MEERKNRWPTEKTIGEECIFWGGRDIGCIFPKKEMYGRESCRGSVDEVCLALKNGRPPESLTPEQILELKTRVPNSPLSIPPGNTRI